MNNWNKYQLLVRIITSHSSYLRREAIVDSLPIINYLSFHDKILTWKLKYMSDKGFLFLKILHYW